MEKKVFYVDLPNPYDLEGPWVNVATFNTRKQAEEFVEECFCDYKGFINIITH